MLQKVFIGWIYVGAFLVANIVANFAYSLAWFYGMQAALLAKSAICGQIIEAALFVDNSALDVGWFTNAIANDAERVFVFFLHLSFGLASIVNLAGVFASLYYWMGPGPASLVVALVAINFFLQRVMSLRNIHVRSKVASLTDARVGVTSETIRSIQVIKLYGWEAPRSSQLADLRSRELRLLKSSGSLQSFSSSAVMVVFWIAQFLGLVLYLELGGAQTSVQLFTIISVITIVRFPMQMLANSTFFYGDAANSLDRLQILFNLLPLSSIQSEQNKLGESHVVPTSLSGPLLELEDCKFAWKGTSHSSVSSCSFLGLPSEVIAVCGATGSGKSTLLSGIAGESVQSGGRLTIRAEFAYAQQTAWIMNGSLRDNIVFFREFDQEWYEQVLRICQLDKDLLQFPHGDETFIGERGVNLSGGTCFIFFCLNILIKKKNTHTH